MMNPVMTGSVEDVLQWSNTFHQLCVYPELVEKVELQVNNCLGWGNKECQGKVEWLKSNDLLENIKR